MEAPEIIYLIRNITTSTSLNTTNDYHGKYLPEWYTSREKDADIEYIRTDVVTETAKVIARHFAEWQEQWADKTMIDKAVEWLSSHFYDVKYQNHDNKGCWIDADTMIEDFKKAMEG